MIISMSKQFWQAGAMFLSGLLVVGVGLAAGSDEFEHGLAVASEKTIEQLKEHLATGSLNRQTSLVIIRDNISPKFDFARLTKSAAGKYWRAASDEERNALVAEFQILLENTYAVAFSKFSGQQVRVVSGSLRADGSKSLMLVISKGDKGISLEYIIACCSDGQWAITDVLVEKISLLTNYRRQFKSVISKNGFQGLIAALRKKNQKTAAR